jgi:mRNA interferase RelE/StbE
MTVELSPKADKYLNALNNPMRQRLVTALKKLTLRPPQGDIVAMSGKDGFRLRVGNYRLLFDIVDNKIVVYDIGLRGQIYKKGR